MTDQLDLHDRCAIIETCLNMSRYLDERRWSDLRTVVADEIDIDFTSYFGGKAMRTSRDDYVRAAEAQLGSLEATQHIAGGHIVTGSGDQARCVSQVQATHVRPNRGGDSHFTVGAQYDMRLARVDGKWLLAGLTATLRWASGNRGVMRAAKSAGPAA